MKFLLFTSALAIVASSASAAHDGAATAGKRRRIIPDKRRRISSTNTVTFPEQVTEALELIHKGAERGSPIQKLVAGGPEDGEEESKKGSDDDNGKSDRDGKDDGKSSSKSSSSSTGGSRRSGGTDRSGGLPEGACKNPHKDDKDDCEEYCDECEYYDCAWLGCLSKSSDVKTFIQKGRERGSPIQKLVAGGPEDGEEESKKGSDDNDGKSDRDSKDDGKSSSSKSSSSSTGGSRRSGGTDRSGGLPEGACKNPHKDDKDDCEDYCDECEYYDCAWLGCLSKSSDGVVRISKNLRRRHR